MKVRWLVVLFEIFSIGVFTSVATEINVRTMVSGNGVEEIFWMFPYGIVGAMVGLFVARSISSMSRA